MRTALWWSAEVGRLRDRDVERRRVDAVLLRHGEEEVRPAVGVDPVVVVPDAATPPGPLAQLSNPANGEGVTASTINAKRYIDVTYSSVDGSKRAPWHVSHGVTTSGRKDISATIAP